MPKSPSKCVLGLLLLLLISSACARPRSLADLSSRPLRITTTVGMIADIVKNIGGERVQVTALMAPGVDPHLYKPSLGDVARLDEADIIFYGGLHLEGRMVDLFEKMNAGGFRAVPISEAIPEPLLLTVDPTSTSHDPHVWFDVSLWQIATQRASDALIELDPGSAELYRANTTRYMRKLALLDTYAREQIATIPPNARVLITAHDAFGYFGARYGLEVRGIQGASTATEANANSVSELARFIAERDIKAIFVESSVPASTVEAVRAAVRARGKDVKNGGELFADAMGADGTPEGTYIGMVRHNVDTIVSALK